jgi:threonine dehydrogenase-like Zn-dependent dehydrogenase
MSLPARCRAALVVAPGRVEVREVSLEPPRPGWAVLQVLRSGICGTDLHTVRGEVRQYVGTPHERTLAYPVVCGHETVGTVAAVEGDVLDHAGRPVAVGDRVVLGPNVVCGACWACRARLPAYACERLEDYGNSLGSRAPHLFGGWAEYMHVLPRSLLVRVPAPVSDDLAALTEPMAVTHGLDRVEGGLAGATVLVLGCGPLGACHIVKARVLGAARVVAVDRHPVRLDVARKLGALALDFEATSREERLQVVRELTEGRGADVAVEASGSPEAFREGLAALRFDGTLLEVGAFVGSRPAEVDLAGDLCLRDVRVVGVGGDDEEAYGPALRLIAERREELGLDRVITHVLSLDRAAEGVELAATGRAVKVLLAPHGAG